MNDTINFNLDRYGLLGFTQSDNRVLFNEKSPGISGMLKWVD